MSTSFWTMNLHDLIESVAAVGTVATVGVLVWDRVWPQTRVVAGVSISRTMAGHRFLRISPGSLSGELMIIRRLKISAGWEITRAETTPMRRLEFVPQAATWQSSLRYRLALDQGHQLGADDMFVFVRERRPIWLARCMPAWARKPNLTLSGELPYRRRPAFTHTVVVHSALVKGWPDVAVAPDGAVQEQPEPTTMRND
ncbi:MAG: hypothetical protein EBR82_02840 [Caulobacteraceae bacterium]|nr:hypothetical protein [Caulobacteraceae bacterium]